VIATLGEERTPCCLTDPAKEPDLNEWKTEVLYQVV
jgi:hypothetical protein